MVGVVLILLLGSFSSLLSFEVTQRNGRTSLEVPQLLDHNHSTTSSNALPATLASWGPSHILPASLLTNRKLSGSSNLKSEQAFSAAQSQSPNIVPEDILRLEETLPTHKYADRMSVQHYAFPGRITVVDKGAANVLLHLFIKCIQKEHIVCSGWGFAEATEDAYQTMAHSLMPEVVEFWEPRIEVRTGFEPKSVLPMKVTMGIVHEHRFRPFYFNVELPNNITTLQPNLYVDDWPRFHFFKNLETEVPAARVRPRDEVYFVMSSFYNSPPNGSYALAAQLLVHHVRHHLKMGLAGDIIYVQHHYASQLLKNSEVAEYVRKGQLEIIVWDSLAQVTGLHYSDQHLQYSHSMLEHWGENVHLIIADVDEFLVASEPKNISSILECVNWTDQARFHRWDAVCTSELCQGESELPAWVSAVDNPLQYYTRINPKGKSWDNPKVMVSPERVHNMFVHEGFVEPGGSEVRVPDQCAFMLHLRFLYRRRDEPLEDYKENTSWQWALRNATIEKPIQK